MLTLSHIHSDEASEGCHTGFVEGEGIVGDGVVIGGFEGAEEIWHCPETEEELYAVGINTKGLHKGLCKPFVSK